MTKATPRTNLGSNLSSAAQALGADDEEVVQLPAAPQTASPKRNDGSELARQRAERKARIIVDENDHTPPNGLVVAANGVSEQIQTGQEADIPLSVLEVLDNAKESVPVTDHLNSVIGYRDRLRVPYRVIKFLD